MLKTLYNNLTESKLPLKHQEQLALTLVDQMRFLPRALPAASNPALKEDLLYFVKSLLARYTATPSRAGFARPDLLQAVSCP